MVLASELLFVFLQGNISLPTNELASTSTGRIQGYDGDRERVSVFVLFPSKCIVWGPLTLTNCTFDLGCVHMCHLLEKMPG